MGRRAKGEGSLSERADGRWDGRIQIAGHRYSVYGATKQEAKARLQALLAQHAQGVDLARAGTLLADYLTRWRDVTLPRLRPSTQRMYTRVIDLIIPRIGTRRLDRLAALDIKRLFGDLHRAGIKPRTIQQCYQVLRTALGEAVRDGLVAYNVCERIEKPSAPPKLQIALTADQVAVLVAGTAEALYGPLWVLLVGTGLRFGEARALRWVDVDFAASTLHVTGSLDMRTNERHAPKTQAGTRMVPLTSQVISALRGQQQRQIIQRAHARFSGHPWPSGVDRADTRLVFTTNMGNPPSPSWVERHWKADLIRLDLPDLPIHGLRRTFASLLHAQGADPLVIARLMGHASFQVTADHYVKVSEAQKAEAMALLNEFGGKRRQEEPG